MTRKENDRGYSLWDEPPSTFERAPIRLAFVSGLSDPRCCRLTEAQQELLDRMATACDRPHELSLVTRNFPFVERGDVDRPEPGLVSASRANAGQYRALRRTAFVDRCLPHWLALRRSSERLRIVTLSCGLELIDRLEARAIGRGESPIDLKIAALGPVVGRRTPLAPLTICGSRDLLSRWFVPRPDVVVPGIGHLGYVVSPIVEEHLNRWLSDSISESSAPEAISPPRS